MNLQKVIDVENLLLGAPTVHLVTKCIGSGFVGTLYAEIHNMYGTPFQHPCPHLVPQVPLHNNSSGVPLCPNSSILILSDFGIKQL